MNIQKKAQTPGGERFAYGNNKDRTEWAPNKGSKRYFTALFPTVETLKQPVTHLPAFAKRLPLKLGIHQDILSPGKARHAQSLKWSARWRAVGSVGKNRKTNSRIIPLFRPYRNCKICGISRAIEQADRRLKALEET
jgi:hypothetical protein